MISGRACYSAQTPKLVGFLDNLKDQKNEDEKVEASHLDLQAFDRVSHLLWLESKGSRS